MWKGQGTINTRRMVSLPRRFVGFYWKLSSHSYPIRFSPEQYRRALYFYLDLCLLDWHRPLVCSKSARSWNRASEKAFIRLTILDIKEIRQQLQIGLLLLRRARTEAVIKVGMNQWHGVPLLGPFSCNLGFPKLHEVPKRRETSWDAAPCSTPFFNPAACYQRRKFDLRHYLVEKDPYCDPFVFSHCSWDRRQLFYHLFHWIKKERIE